MFDVLLNLMNTAITLVSDFLYDPWMPLLPVGQALSFPQAPALCSRVC